MIDVRETTIAPRVSWGAIFAGFFFLLALWSLLAVLGVAIGLTTMEPRESVTRVYGVGTLIWAVLAAVLASFFGGWLSARVAGALWRQTGVFHAAVVWALTAVVGVTSLGSGIFAAATGMRAPTQQAIELGAATAWGVFVLLALSLAACLAGGAVGALEGPRKKELEARREVTPPPTVPSTPAPTPTRP